MKNNNSTIKDQKTIGMRKLLELEVLNISAGAPENMQVGKSTRSCDDVKAPRTFKVGNGQPLGIAGRGNEKRRLLKRKRSFNLLALAGDQDEPRKKKSKLMDMEKLKREKRMSILGKIRHYTLNGECNKLRVESIYPKGNQIIINIDRDILVITTKNKKIKFNQKKLETKQYVYSDIIEIIKTSGLIHYLDIKPSVRVKFYKGTKRLRSAMIKDFVTDSIAFKLIVKESVQKPGMVVIKDKTTGRLIKNKMIRSRILKEYHGVRSEFLIPPVPIEKF